MRQRPGYFFVAHRRNKDRQDKYRGHPIVGKEGEEVRCAFQRNTPLFLLLYLLRR